MPQWIPEKMRKELRGNKKKLNEKRDPQRFGCEPLFFNHLEIPLLIQSSLRLNYG